MGNGGRPKHPAGLRLYNQKYYRVNYDEEDQHLYLKKVLKFRLRNTEELVYQQPRTTTSSAPSTSRTRWITVFLKTRENSTRESRSWPKISRVKDTDYPLYMPPIYSDPIIPITYSDNISQTFSTELEHNVRSVVVVNAQYTSC